LSRLFSIRKPQRRPIDLLQPPLNLAETFGPRRRKSHRGGELIQTTAASCTFASLTLGARCRTGSPRPSSWKEPAADGGVVVFSLEVHCNPSSFGRPESGATILCVRPHGTVRKWGIRKWGTCTDRRVRLLHRHTHCQPCQHKNQGVMFWPLPAGSNGDCRANGP
jgi:hypothetical protein